MRVLIISSLRCGGNSLLYWLSKELNIKYISEPYNKSIYESPPDIYSDNLIVKFPYQQFNFLDNVDGFIKTFDKVVALTRNNTREACESGVFNLIINKTQKNYQFLKSYYIDEEFLNKYEKHINCYINEYEKINESIKKIDVLQLTYENIFINKTDLPIIKEYFNIDFSYLKIIDSKYKYRKINKDDNKNSYFEEYYLFSKKIKKLNSLI
jgi:hypothetical protein